MMRAGYVRHGEGMGEAVRGGKSGEIRRRLYEKSDPFGKAK